MFAIYKYLAANNYADHDYFWKMMMMLISALEGASRINDSLEALDYAGFKLMQGEGNGAGT